jgi:flagellar assembly protein FliH
MSKYLFNTVFDDEANLKRDANKEELIKEEQNRADFEPPVYLAEDLEAARHSALKQGIQEGKAEAMISIEQEMSLSLESVSLKMNNLFSNHQKWTEVIQRDSIKLAHAIVRKLAPELMRETELPQIEKTIKEAFQFLSIQPQVTIQVSENLREPLRDKISLISANASFNGEVTLAGDATLPDGDCKVVWESGAVERSISNTWEQIDNIVARVLLETDKSQVENTNQKAVNGEQSELKQIVKHN